MKANARINKTPSLLLNLAIISTQILLSSCADPTIYNSNPEFSLGHKAESGDSMYYSFSNYAATSRSPKLKPDLIIVTFSGGGIRAAAFAAATIDELQKFEIDNEPITNNIILISSTSGGSIASAYMAVHGLSSYPEFRRTFLTKPNTKDLIMLGIGPRLFYDRSAIMRDFLESRLNLGSMTYGELIKRNDRPFIIMNATNINSGQPFPFTHENFRKIYTDLRPMPISVGMTASSAFPFLLTDVELKNRIHECSICLNSSTLKPFYYSSRDAVVDRHDFNIAHAYDDSLEIEDRSRPKYIHLADGGLVDNLGTGGVDYIDIDAGASISDQIDDPDQSRSGIRQVLVIEVNARSDRGHPELDAEPGGPGLISMLGLTIDIAIDRTTTLTDAALQTGFQAVESITPYARDGVYLTQIDFDLLDDNNSSLRSRVKAIRTSLTLSESELTDLETASRLLLRSSPCFARYVEISGAVGPDYSPPPSRGTGTAFDCFPLMLLTTEF